MYRLTNQAPRLRSEINKQKTWEIKWALTEGHSVNQRRGAKGGDLNRTVELTLLKNFLRRE